MAQNKNVLVIASNWGFWGEELQAAWDALRQAGHQTVLATPQGKKPLPFKISVDPDFVDPIQNYHVNPPEVCDRVKELLANGGWDNPIRIADASMADYDALVLAGGPGTDLDLTNNPAVHRLVSEGLAQGKLVAAMCFAVACLAFTRDPDNNYRSVIYGREVTAHPRAWDFRDDLTYDLYEATSDNPGTDVVTPGFLLPIQDVMTDAVGPEGRVFSDPDTNRENPSVVTDGPFITATSVESSIAYGKKIVERLAE
ncbi:MAG: DJ-1/PfpI family protein [Pseudomonadota bacterium]